MYDQQENDYELLYMIYQKDDESLKLLVEKYEKIMHLFYQNQMSLMYHIRWHIDQYQIGRIVLLKAIEYFRLDKQVTFRHFYLVLLRNEMKNAVRRNQIDFHTYGYSTDFLIYETGEDYLEDAWKETNPRMQADWLVRCEETRLQILKVESFLKPIEKKIVRLRLYGYSYNEISRILNVRLKKVDNTLYKVRNYKV